MFSRVLTQQRTLVSYWFLRFLLISLPQLAPPLSLSLSLSLTRFNSRYGFLEYIFGLINSSCSAPRLLLALTQTASN
ncbi:unnamed protein product [Hymenolepis diminuta]|uniref:Uncharacterized protein n=1 Tax=Hymenolepis diminuta TaxID=6216 RepID=A0A564Z8U9_HYMDI|nr:unnamed protein product [Hymenolepis diminuta]